MPNRIKQRREELHLTQKDLAKLVGVTPGYINRIEKLQTKDMKLVLAIRIARALNSTVEEIFLAD